MYESILKLKNDKQLKLKAFHFTNKNNFLSEGLDDNGLTLLVFKHLLTVFILQLLLLSRALSWKEWA